MSEILSDENLARKNDKVLFCRKCGQKLCEGNLQCFKCATVVECISETPHEDTSEILELKNHDSGIKASWKNKSFTKRFLLPALSVLLVVAIFFTGFYFWKTRIIKQDINAINGCPEFYDLEFGMTVEEASENIKLKHKAINGIDENSLFEVDDFMKSSHIIIEEGEVFYLFGRETTDVYVGFNGKYIDNILLSFSQHDYKLKDIVSLYEKIYGEPTIIEATCFLWIGSKTAIDIFETDSVDGEKVIMVSYIISTNSQYKALSFNGTELDPCGFLSENYAFNKKPAYYINGLKEGDDYDEETYSTFSQYTLYPKFEYMGISKGYTAIEFTKDSKEEYIGLVSYNFLLDDKNAVDRMKYIYSKLSEKYGVEVGSIYTSASYGKRNVTDISFDEIIKKISSGTEGMYNVQWENIRQKITLSLIISANQEYYDGSVSFTY